MKQAYSKWSSKGWNGYNLRGGILRSYFHLAIKASNETLAARTYLVLKSLIVYNFSHLL